MASISSETVMGRAFRYAGSIYTGSMAIATASLALVVGSAALSFAIDNNQTMHTVGNVAGVSLMACGGATAAVIATTGIRCLAGDRKDVDRKSFDLDAFATISQGLKNGFEAVASHKIGSSWIKNDRDTPPQSVEPHAAAPSGQAPG